jgi:hypothetical protein
MRNSQQVEAVKKALELEMCVADNTQILEEPTPEPPTRNVIKRVYPKIVPQTKINWLLALLPAIPLLFATVVVGAIVWVCIYYFAIYKRKKDEEIRQIQNSPQYKAQCAAADREFDKMQEEADADYQIQKHEYDTEILPKYHEEVEKAKYDLKIAKAALDDLYSTTKIVPLQYREIPILQYIYDTISTSDFDVKYTIELYEKNEQRKLDEARLYEQQQANQLASEQNDIAEKIRRDQNIANVVGAVQRHNTNKALNNMFKK